MMIIISDLCCWLKTARLGEYRTAGLHRRSYRYSICSGGDNNFAFGGATALLNDEFPSCRFHVQAAGSFRDPI
jgi:hypothetical protein